MNRKVSILQGPEMFFWRFPVKIIFAELGHQLTGNRSLERELDNLAKHRAYN